MAPWVGRRNIPTIPPPQNPHHPHRPCPKGEDYDGCILFDECHKAKNLTKGTQTGINVQALQDRLPNAVRGLQSLKPPPNRQNHHRHHHHTKTDKTTTATTTTKTATAATIHDPPPTTINFTNRIGSAVPTNPPPTLPSARGILQRYGCFGAC